MQKDWNPFEREPPSYLEKKADEELYALLGELEGPEAALCAPKSAATAREEVDGAPTPAAAVPAAPTPVVAASAATASRVYEFPVTLRPEPTGESESELLTELAKLSGASAGSYFKVRERYCAINAMLNMVGRTPPAFRPARRLHKRRKGAAWSWEETVLHRDRQIIDLDWLHRLGLRNKIDDRNYCELLRGDQLDLGQAEAFAGEGWKASSKGQLLALSELQQLQTTSFRSKTVSDRVSKASAKADRDVRAKLRDRADRSRGTQEQVDALCDLWLARKLGDGYAQKVIGEIYAWLRNEEQLAASTLSAKLARLDRWLA